MTYFDEVQKRLQLATPFEDIWAECFHCGSSASIALHDGKNDLWATEKHMEFFKHAPADIAELLRRLRIAEEALKSIGNMMGPKSITGNRAITALAAIWALGDEK